jgi:hypothetical protein
MYDDIFVVKDMYWYKVRLSSFVEVVVNVIGLYVVRFNNHP